MHAVDPRARVGWLALVLGGALALVVQVMAPVGAPLYDGVVVQEPYRYLRPAGGQAGDPSSFSETIALEGSESPVIVAATVESPPQAQLIAQRAAFEIPDGATSLLVSVTPIEPPANPSDGVIAGNVYRFAVTDQSGRAVGLPSCDGCRSLVLRAPEGVDDGTIRRFADGTWIDVESVHAGVVAMYQTNVDVLGDFAVFQGAVDGPQLDLTLILLGGGIVLVLVGFVALLALRGRPAPGYPSRPDRRGSSIRPDIPSRIPSKRKRGRRPPSGRSEP